MTHPGHTGQETKQGFKPQARPAASLLPNFANFEGHRGSIWGTKLDGPFHHCSNLYSEKAGELSVKSANNIVLGSISEHLK